MQSHYERTAEDLCFEQRILATYEPLCKHFCYTKLVDVARPNWDRTSRQATICSLAEGQPLYFQPESRGQDAILMVNANGQGAGLLEPHIAKQISQSLLEGIEWRAHVRQVRYTKETQSWNVIIVLLLMDTADSDDQLRARKLQKNFSIEWTMVAVLLLGIALMMV